jgi:hypothetical protein
MKFSKRLKYFAIGFSIGLLFVFGLFKDREFKWAWLPGNRVTNFILSHPIKINQKKINLIDQNGKFSNEIYNTILNGDVDFSNSETKKVLKYYTIQYKKNSLYLAMSFKDSMSQILKFNNHIFSENKILNKSDSNLYMDSENFLHLINKKEKKFSKSFLCQLKKHNIIQNTFENSFHSLKVKWNSSKPYLKPYAFYIGSIFINNISFDILIEEGSEKVRIKGIRKTPQNKSQNYITKSDFELECD